MEREGRRGCIGISKQFSAREKESELELDNYIVKEVIICAPVLLLLRVHSKPEVGDMEVSHLKGICAKKPQKTQREHVHVFVNV